MPPASSLLLLGLLAAASPPPSKAAASTGVAGNAQGSAALWAVLGRFDEYPGSTPYQIADEMELGSAEMKMAGFQTADPPEKIVAFYLAEFQREKLFIPPGAPEGIPFSGVTAFDPISGLQKTVMVMPGAGGPTRVVLSISPEDGLTDKALAPAKDAPAGLPVFPASDGVYRTDAKDGFRTSSTVSYHANGNPAVVLDYIRKGLASQGWSQVPHDPKEPEEGLRYRRDRELVDLSLLPLGGATQVTYVYIH